MTKIFPSLYISHGSPMLMLTNTAAHGFLSSYGKELGKPSAILVASAHFETDGATALTADRQPEMIYDFGDFPRALFEMQYPAPGSPDLAARAAQLLRHAAIPARPVEGRGFDHGTWVPLKLLYPDADIPVVQVSVQPGLGAVHHAAMGRALAPLRDEGVLIVGSGSLTHNLYEIGPYRGRPDAPAPDWVKDFGAWVHEKAEAGALDEIVAYRERAPHARENHPSEEHYLPLPFAMAAAGEGTKGRRVHTSHEYGVLMLDAYAFG
jgi:4,5-DOPA dioxygenase extradiol